MKTQDQPTLFDEDPQDALEVALTALFDPTRLVRTTDPDTSHTAATNASKRGPSQRRRTWEALIRLGEATDYELAEATHILRSSAAKRRQELQQLGHVIDTGKRRPTDTGTMAIVWAASPVSHYSGS